MHGRSHAADGRRVVEGGPITVEYSITRLGRTALDCLDSLRRWSETLPPGLVDVDG